MSVHAEVTQTPEERTRLARHGSLHRWPAAEDTGALPAPARLAMRRAAPLSLLLLLSFAPAAARAQRAPAGPDRIWQPSRPSEAAPGPASRRLILDPAHTYTLAELVDLAEQHNPQTRVAWQRAKAQAFAAGVARSALFPVLAAGAMAESVRQAVLFNAQWYQQTEGIFEPSVSLNYTVFDYNGRLEALAGAKAALVAQNFNFNETHLQIIYQVTVAYYDLLNAVGQLDAAQVNLQNATAVQQDAEARLVNGLATLPDVLEARSAAAQANYELVTAEGNRIIAQGHLATTLGASPASTFRVQPLDQVAPPGALNDSAENTIARALKDRPDLLAQAAQIRAAHDAVVQTRSTFLPTLGFSGNIGYARAYGEQLGMQGVYASGELWNAQLNLQWDLFEGGRRRSQLARAEAEQKQAQADLDTLRDDAEDQVWAAYTNVKTAYAQQLAAAMLLTAAQTSWEAATEAYKDGVRTLIDVVSAQRALAEARSEDVTARTQLLRQTATLAFRTGDLLQMARHP